MINSTLNEMHKLLFFILIKPNNYNKDPYLNKSFKESCCLSFLV